MAGMPVKRARREEREAQDRPKIPGRHVPRVAPAEWRKMNDVEKIRLAFGFSLDDAVELGLVPWAAADLHERTMKIRVFEIAMKYATRIGVERERQERYADVLAGLAVALAKRTDGDDDAK